MHGSLETGDAPEIGEFRGPPDQMIFTCTLLSMMPWTIA
jgi:hypothetical protein